MPATAAVIVSKANAWARSARATPAGGCRRLLALNWPLTGTITRQRSISGEHIWLIVSVEVESSRHRPTRTTKMAADQSARRTRPPEVVHGYQERIEQTRWSPVRRIRPERQLPRSYRGIATFLRALLMVLTRRDWRGAEHFPSAGGFVVCPNHISYVDPFAFSHFLYDNGHPPFFLAKAEVFRIPILGRLLTAAQQIPKERAGRYSPRARACRRGRRRQQPKTPSRPRRCRGRPGSAAPR